MTYQDLPTGRSDLIGGPLRVPRTGTISITCLPFGFEMSVSSIIPNFRGLLLALALLLSMPSLAQINPEIANCEELKDEATVTQAEICSAHPGCNLVFKIHKACTVAKGFIQRLGAMLSGRKTITYDDVFEASARPIVSDAAFEAQSRALRARDREQPERFVLSGTAPSGTRWTYEGGVKDNKPNGFGVQIAENGTVHRSEFKDGAQVGTREVTFPFGERTIGESTNYVWQGKAIARFDTGDRYEGQMKDGAREGQGTFTWANGQVFTGNYKKNQVDTGTLTKRNGDIATYSGGKVVSEVTQLELSVRKEVEDERKRKAAQAEADYRASLGTLNAGQLFALADQMRSDGNTSKAREVLRSLVSRFPDHPLAATGAQQLAALANSAAAPISTTTSSQTASGGNAGSNGGSTAGAAPNRSTGASATSSVRGLAFAECARLDAASDVSAKLNRVPKDDTNKLLRGVVVASDWMIQNYSQCLPDAKAQQAVDQYKKTREDSLRTCRQISSQDNCLVSPF